MPGEERVLGDSWLMDTASDRAPTEICPGATAFLEPAGFVSPDFKTPLARRNEVLAGAEKLDTIGADKEARRDERCWKRMSINTIENTKVIGEIQQQSCVPDAGIVR